jgi:opacity protein-like surface antigen
MMKSQLAFAGTLFFFLSAVQADEQLFGFVRGAETLPQGRTELYQFATMRSGKSEGIYRGFDFESEIEHALTDNLQVSLSIENRYIYNHGVTGERDELADTDAYRWGGISTSAKYRLLSPFKDPIGLAVRVESGYLWHDEVDGLVEHERYIKPEIDLQKDFFEDRLICNLDFGVGWAWGKQPAEQYPKELAFEGAAGVAYRFAPNWFAGAEIHTRWEYPQFDLYNFEHRVYYAGPALHYSQKNWWVTLTYNYQIYGKGVGEPNDGQTFAEETRHLVRLKVGFNF